MLKKLLLFAFLLFVLLFLSPYSTSASTQYTTNNMNEFKQILGTRLLNFDKTFSIKYTGSLSDFEKEEFKMLDKIVGDNRFILLNSTVVGYNYSIQYSENYITVYYTPNYTLSKQKHLEASNKAKAIAASISKNNSSNLDKVFAVNEYLTKNISYDLSYRDNAYTMYGALIERSAVCQGYALSAYMILKELGFDVRYVIGVSMGEGHSWNKVKIDGVWYNLDVTWNDPIPNEPNQTAFNYFLVSDKVLAKDHTWNTKKYPASTNSKFDTLKNAYFATKVGSTIYYSTTNAFYSFNVVTNKVKKVSSHDAYYMFKYKNIIYFSDYSKKGRLTSYDPSKNTFKTLNQVESRYAYIKGNTIFYKNKGKWFSIVL